MADVFLKTKTKTFMTVPKCVIDMVEKKNNLRAVEAQIVQKLKNNEARKNLLVFIKKSV